MKNKVYDMILFVGGTGITLLGFFGTLHMGIFFSPYSNNWYDILFMIIGVSMIVFGFVRRSWNEKENQ